MNLEEDVMRLVHRACRLANSVVPPGASNEAIAALENSIGFPIPDELKSWLRLCNAPKVRPERLIGVFLDGSLYSVEGHYRYTPQWKTNGWIPIAGDGSGDYYVLDSKSLIGDTHPVYFCDQDEYETAGYVVASGLWHFLRFYLLDGMTSSDEGYWPFNKERVLAEDPQLALNVGNVPLPWDA